jgi:hypothetical protein
MEPVLAPPVLSRLQVVNATKAMEDSMRMEAFQELRDLEVNIVEAPIPVLTSTLAIQMDPHRQPIPTQNPSQSASGDQNQSESKSKPMIAPLTTKGRRLGKRRKRRSGNGEKR